MLPREIKVKVADWAVDPSVLLLGKVGENEATKVIFDVSGWQDNTDEGTYKLLVRRADQVLFVGTTETVGNTVVWLIPAEEIGAAGYGRVELNYMIGNAVAKSIRIKTRVFSSVEIDTIAANGITWSQLVLAAVTDARTAADTIEVKIQEAIQQAAEQVQRAATEANNAHISAMDASNYATDARTARDSALSAADNADTFAANASVSASTAAASATQAAASAAQAAESASAATIAADIAAQLEEDITSATEIDSQLQDTIDSADDVKAEIQEVIDSIPADYSALNNEVDDLKSALSTTNNILKMDDDVPIEFDIINVPGSITYNNGSVGTSSVYYPTDFIDISSFSEITYKQIKAPSGTFGIAFYKSDYSYLSGINHIRDDERGYAESTVPVPDGACFLRATTFIDTETYGEFTISGKSILFDKTFCRRGYLDEMQVTRLQDCVLSGWYGILTSYQAEITDLPDGYTAGDMVLNLNVYAGSGKNSSGDEYITQELYATSTSDKWTRVMVKSSAGTITPGTWTKINYHADLSPESIFMFRGYLADMGYTDLKSCTLSGWYGISTAYQSTIADDLPEDYEAGEKRLFIEVRNPEANSNNKYVIQLLKTDEGDSWIRCIRVGHSSNTYIETVYGWNRQSSSGGGGDSYWSGKKVAWFGDSLSAGSGLNNKENAFSRLTAKALGMEIYLHAIGGSVIAKQSEAEADPTKYPSGGYYDEIAFDYDEWVNERVIGTKYLVHDTDDPQQDHPFRIWWYDNELNEWTHTNAYTSVINGRYPIVDMVKCTESDADLIVIALGFNDFMYHWTAFGDMTSRDENSFYGALHKTCQYLLENYPDKQVAFVKVLASRYQISGSIQADWSCLNPDSANPLSKTIGDYRKAMDEVCAYYSIPCLDLGGNLGFAQWMHPATYYQKASTDNLHWNADGHRRAASVIIPMIEGLRK